jgi:hypothetical protein
MAVSTTAFFANINVSKSNMTVSMDIFGITSEAQKDFFSDMQTFTEKLSKGGEVTLSDGTKVDPSSVAGMTVFNVHLQIIQANIELVNNIFTFVRNFEQKLENMLAG